MRISSLLSRPDNKAYKNKRTKTHKCLVYMMRITESVVVIDVSVVGICVCVCIAGTPVAGVCVVVGVFFFFFFFFNEPLGFCYLFVDWV